MITKRNVDSLIAGTSGDGGTAFGAGLATAIALGESVGAFEVIDAMLVGFCVTGTDGFAATVVAVAAGFEATVEATGSAGLDGTRIIATGSAAAGTVGLTAATGFVATVVAAGFAAIAVSSFGIAALSAASIACCFKNRAATFGSTILHSIGSLPPWKFSFCAAAFERSRHTLLVNGPRSLTVTMHFLPFLLLVTSRCVPKGSVL